ncbi:MAG TPA: hypothetical protein DCE44_12025, partial [Verrucomicrobiales bacterium]|nr:hypothetical protein [Verrucomicrobiales bacterium]
MDAVQFSPDARLLARGRNEGCVAIYDLISRKTGDSPLRYAPRSGRRLEVAFGVFSEWSAGLIL